MQQERQHGAPEVNTDRRWQGGTLGISKVLLTGYAETSSWYTGLHHTHTHIYIYSTTH